MTEADTKSSEELMLELARGMHNSLGEIVNRHHREAWCIAYRYMQNREDAEDIVQEAFLRLFTTAERYKPQSKFRTFFIRIVINLCLDALRRPRLFQGIEDMEIEEPACNDIAFDLISKEESATIMNAINRLPENQRTAIILKTYEDMSYKEIADVMNTTPKAVESLLGRARKGLMEELSLFYKE